MSYNYQQARNYGQDKTSNQYPQPSGYANQNANMQGRQMQYANEVGVNQIKVQNKQNVNKTIHRSFSQNGRIGFIRKVYGILCFQLLMTVFFAGLSMLKNPYSDFQITYQFTQLFAVIGFCCSALCIVCNRELVRTVPQNYACLFIFTFCESYMLGYVVRQYNPQVVFAAAFMTAMVTIGLTVYAWTTKSDFTMQGGFLFIISFALLGLGITSFLLESEFIYMVYCLGGVILYGFYLIYDTQLLIGKGRMKYSTDDYIVAAIQLYLDIIIIFLKLLEILGSLSK